VDFLEIGEETLLAEILGFLLEHFAVSDDGVHGRAQFVAHVGEELALGFVGASAASRALSSWRLDSASAVALASISARAISDSLRARCSSSNNRSRNCSASRLRRMTRERAMKAQANNPATRRRRHHEEGVAIPRRHHRQLREQGFE